MRMKAWLGRAATLTTLLLIITATPSEAHTKHLRKHNRVAVALQPFMSARAALHAAIDPVVLDAPRVLGASMHVAYQTSSIRNERIFSGEVVDENEDVPERDAYFTNRVHRQRPPRAEIVEPLDDDDDDGPRRAESHEDLRGGARPMVSGNRAVLRNGVAHAPTNAPERVKNAIWAANSLRTKPYIWGGGHGSFQDRGYDCSGTVSFALHNAGLLATPLPSSELMRYGEGGRGRWITIYSRHGHTFAMIAGLRLDTTDFAIGGNVGPRWHTDGRDTFGYVARHPVGL